MGKATYQLAQDFETIRSMIGGFSWDYWDISVI